MNDPTLKPSRRKALSSIFAQHPEIQAVYLFGLAAAGTTRALYSKIVRKYLDFCRI